MWPRSSSTYVLADVSRFTAKSNGDVIISRLLESYGVQVLRVIFSVRVFFLFSFPQGVFFKVMNGGEFFL